MKKKISIIVPVYNTKNIRENIKTYLAAIEKFEKNYEMIVVDDGSWKDCLKKVKSIKNKHLNAVGYKKNLGKGNAIKYGFNFANGDYIAFLDSGAEFDAYQIKNFMDIMIKEKADIVIGSKRHKDSRVYYPLTRRIMSRIYQIMNMFLFNLDIRDTQVGIKLFKKEALKKIMPRILVKKFAYDIEILALAKKYGFKIIEAPITMNYKFGSTIKLRAVISMFLDTLAVFYRLKILRWYDKD